MINVTQCFISLTQPIISYVVNTSYGDDDEDEDSQDDDASCDNY